METAHAGDRPTLCGLLGGSFDPFLCRGRGVEAILEVKGAGMCGEVQAAADRPASSRAGEDAHPKTLGRWLLPAAGPRGVAVVTGVGRAFVAVTSALRERPPSSVGTRSQLFAGAPVPIRLRASRVPGLRAHHVHVCKNGEHIWGW